MHTVEESVVGIEQWSTYYRWTAESEGPPERGRPLLVLHGGPGCTHDYLVSLSDLVSGNRSVIHYDQLGNGRSTHMPEAPYDFWTVDLFLRELENLISELGICEYDLLGHSWGGMLAAEHALRRPSGLRNLVIANSPASMQDWVDAAAELRSALPPEVQEALLRNEHAGTTDSQEYRAAMSEFYDRHVCRSIPTPPEVAATFEWIDTDPTVYHTMNGPSEFHVIGSLRNWSVKERLSRIQTRTLVINGAYDEATDRTVEPFVREISGARWVRFEHSSHMPHIEERELFMKVVADFLDGKDT
ncbi:proline iminopeptidase-family hydrolase [Rhodococcus sp. IEGM 1409]|uniref:proline iminopeptidase-family hydrolase n=1 Tax=Rhodococcus sp. IEGM 1409 TaxID=3047082 RepID=UPI0024B7EC7D|nr:proline iminopeptidase-family hydrolase [Rhodococcus sp. IEGM 1409]MDI9898760.1 proline iminopeptidase-family hydrolase [Rhodococcus sp. IEGM 1409]